MVTGGREFDDGCNAPHLGVHVVADISGDAATLKTFIADARPAMGGALVMVSEDSELLQALAAELGLDNAHAFEHATGLLLAYPKEGEDGGEWTLIRRLSHE